MSASSAPLINVVIATHSRPAYLQNAVASVVNGDYRDVEIIVSDDLGSHVNRETARPFADPRVVYHRNETMPGAGPNHIQTFQTWCR